MLESVLERSQQEMMVASGDPSLGGNYAGVVRTHLGRKAQENDDDDDDTPQTVLPLDIVVLPPDNTVVTPPRGESLNAAGLQSAPQQQQPQRMPSRMSWRRSRHYQQQASSPTAPLHYGIASLTDPAATELQSEYDVDSSKSGARHRMRQIFQCLAPGYDSNSSSSVYDCDVNASSRLPDDFRLIQEPATASTVSTFLEPETTDPETKRLSYKDEQEGVVVMESETSSNDKKKKKKSKKGAKKKKSEIKETPVGDKGELAFSGVESADKKFDDGEKKKKSKKKKAIKENDAKDDTQSLQANDSDKPKSDLISYPTLDVEFMAALDMPDLPSLLRQGTHDEGLDLTETSATDMTESIQEDLGLAENPFFWTTS